MRSSLIRVAAAAAAVLAAAAAVALAAAATHRAAASAVVNACAGKDGRLRAVTDSAACRNDEHALSWNVEGPSGPAGAQGPPGPPGPPGAGLASFDDLGGLPCSRPGATGAIHIDYATDGVATITCAVAAAGGGGGVPTVRVNEISTGTAASAADEFVELVNSGTGPADVGGWKVVYRSATGTSDVALATIPDGTTIAAGGFYLLGGGAYAGAQTPDQSFSSGLAGAGGAVGVRDGTGALADGAGWGTATNALVEGTAAPAPPATAPPGSSIVRLPDGHDTDDNVADFGVSSTPTPRASNR